MVSMQQTVEYEESQRKTHKESSTAVVTDQK